MKLSATALFAAIVAAPASALQSPYLSQLNGGGAAVRSPQVSSPVAPDKTVNPAYPATPEMTTGSTSQELVNLWSDQVSVELAASQLYLSASIWCHDRGLPGMAAWMLEESGEERGHGLAILDFAMKRNFPVQLKALDAPKCDWITEAEVWEDILHAEKTNTQNLLRLADAADRCGEYGCKAFLNPFHMEQIDAEEKVGSVLAKVKGAPQLLMELDHQLGIEAEEEEGH